MYNEKSDEKIWNVLKKVKFSNLSKKGCLNGQIDIDGHYTIRKQFEEVTEMLDINSTKIFPYGSMNDDILERAANMFMYMIFCPDDTKAWVFFYTDLLTKQPVDKIVLTLHRIMKSEIPKLKNSSSLQENFIQRSLLSFHLSPRILRT